MASRRLLKKQINYITNVIAGWCIWEKSLAKEEKKDCYTQLLSDVLAYNGDILRRISHTEPGNVKGFYKKLRDDFNTKNKEFFEKLKELAD